MKKLTFVMALLAISVMSFAQGKITYVLNGGITHESWTCPQDMYNTLTADIEAYNPAMDIEWAKLDSVGLKPYNTGVATPYGSGYQKITETLLQDANFQAHFAWLVTYMQDLIAAESGMTALDYAGGAALRSNLTSFFFNCSANNAFPYTVDYTSRGVATYDAYKDYWKCGFKGPDTYAEGEVVVNLPAPYPANPKEESFLGWYKDEACEEERVTEISGKGDVTLYAKYGEYIPNVAEAAALEDNAATKVAGTVSRVIGDEFWLQDSYAGIYCSQAVHGLEAGKKVVLSATKTTVNGIPALKDITVVEQGDGKAITPQALLIADILADSTAKYISELVQLDGVTVHYADGKTYFVDREYQIELVGLTLDATTFPEKKRVVAIALVSENAGVRQLRALAADITVAATAGKDPYAYPEVTDSVSGQKFNLRNNWLYSVNLENWAANKPNPVPQGSRSVIYKDGILYFAYRSSNGPTDRPYIARVDAKTGAMLDPVYFADDIMKLNGEYIFGPFSDMKLDDAGNAISSTLPTAGGPYQIWSIDLATGAGKLLVDMTATGQQLKDRFPNDPTIRLDRIGVQGDIEKDAVIMAPSASTKYVYRWNIKNGKWNPITGIASLVLKMEGDLGTAPQIKPVEDGYFYVDGFATHATLFDSKGNYVDGFAADSPLLLNKNGQTRATQKNGVLEFKVGEDYYLIVAGGGSTNDPAGTFVLYKFKDDTRAFAEMTQLYEFPDAGMGAAEDQQRVGTPFAVVAEDEKSVELYVYIAETGYGSYTFYLGDAPVSGLNNTSLSNDVNVKKVLENGQVVIIKDGVRYNVLGTQL